MIYKTTFRKLGLFSISGQKRLVVSNGTARIVSSQLSYPQTKTNPDLETLRREVLTAAGSLQNNGQAPYCVDFFVYVRVFTPY